MTVMHHEMPQTAEAPHLPRRHRNHRTLLRLFQGYISDFGPDDGQKIIHAVADELGGLRLVIPHNGSGSGESTRALFGLYCRLRLQFGEASGSAAMRSLLRELRGLRVSFPGHQDLYRAERDRRIRAAYNGSNLTELALAWGLSHTRVKMILREDGDSLPEQFPVL